MASDDRLSVLPLGIIHDILARVPIRDAIRTSFLSRQWRYTWTTLPNLLFKSSTVVCRDYRNDGLMKKFGKSTHNFITNVLILHNGPIHRFKMSYPYAFSIDWIEAWIFYLSMNDIKELIIKIDRFWDCDAKMLKPGIYSCAKLTKLVLQNFTMDPPPSTFKGFLFLKSLALLEVELSACGVETLVDNCPLPESLIIVYCSSSEITIRSPNLKKLELSGDFMKLCLYAPLLVDMNMGLMYLSIGIEFCHPTLVFHYLKALYLDEVDFRDAKELAVVAHLIISAPNLHKLEITTNSEYEVGAPDLSFEDFGLARNFTLEKLRDVSMYDVCVYPCGVHLIKF